MTRLGTLPPCCVTVSKRDGLYFERLLPLYFERRVLLCCQKV